MTSTNVPIHIKNGNYVPTDIHLLGPAFITNFICQTQMKSEGILHGAQGRYLFQRRKVGPYETILFGDMSGKALGMVLTDLRNYHHRVFEDASAEFYSVMEDILAG